jgi:GNAT superfamily N-acetyltransferase
MMIRAPEPLGSAHDTHPFDCGTSGMNQWLQQRALKNQLSGASRTYVACDQNRVCAYYSLATGAIAPDAATGRFRRNMPSPVPVVILGRLAVDVQYQHRGLGRALLRDAAIRVVQAADLIGIRGLIVHALDDDARQFYQQLGFSPSPLEPMTLMISLQDIRALLT